MSIIMRSHQQKGLFQMPSQVIIQPGSDGRAGGVEKVQHAVSTMTNISGFSPRIHCGRLYARRRHAGYRHRQHQP
jgi:hypothetical protein